jgi:hypothetical protein
MGHNNATRPIIVGLISELDDWAEMCSRVILHKSFV